MFFPNQQKHKETTCHKAFFSNGIFDLYMFCTSCWNSLCWINCWFKDLQDEIGDIPTGVFFFSHCLRFPMFIITLFQIDISSPPTYIIINMSPLHSEIYRYQWGTRWSSMIIFHPHHPLVEMSPKSPCRTNRKRFPRAHPDRQWWTCSDLIHKKIDQIRYGIDWDGRLLGVKENSNFTLNPFFPPRMLLMKKTA